MITRDSIVIRRGLAEVYGVARDIGRQHEYIPGYRPSRVTPVGDGTLIVERSAQIGGNLMTWKSRASFRDRAIEFEQVEGRLKGMRIAWEFEPAPEGTRVTITHRLDWNFPVLGWAATRFLVKPNVDALTRNVLIGLKNRLEDGVPA